MADTTHLENVQIFETTWNKSYLDNYIPVPEDERGAYFADNDVSHDDGERCKEVEQGLKYKAGSQG